MLNSFLNMMIEPKSVSHFTGWVSDAERNTEAALPTLRRAKFSSNENFYLFDFTSHSNLVRLKSRIAKEVEV